MTSCQYRALTPEQQDLLDRLTGAVVIAPRPRYTIRTLATWEMLAEGDGDEH